MSSPPWLTIVGHSEVINLFSKVLLVYNSLLFIVALSSVNIGRIAT